jgi:RNA polymerase sigma factor (sigma-70 family)
MLHVVQREEFSKWWAEIEPSLLRIASHYTASSNAARDLVQDVAVLALRNASRFATADDLYRWTRPRVRWLMLDQLKKQQPLLLDEDVEQIAGQSTAVDQGLIIRDTMRSIAKLPAQQQAALRGMLEGRSTQEIAKDLQVTEATVRSLQRFARRKLIILLEEEGGAI